MTNELRKNLMRNMRYSKMNEQIDSEIKQLQYNNSPEAQMQINNLRQQRQDIEKLMNKPMTEQEYEQYDDDGYYSEDNTRQNSNGIGQAFLDGTNHLAHGINQEWSDELMGRIGDIGQTFLDGANHMAQGVSLGWSDELMGAIGGIGRVTANGVMRAAGQNVNGESFSDAWNKGYQEYRDFARQELKDGSERNPTISTVAEIAGAAISPVTPFKTRGYTGSLGKFIAHPKDIASARWRNTIGTGVISGIGTTDENTLGNYAKNIIGNTIANVGGTFFGNKLFGRGNNMYRFGRSVMNGAAQTTPYIYNYFRKPEDNEK